MGAVDVWRCRDCDQLFCEDKRYGMTDLAPEVGLPKIEPNTHWAALICTRDKGSNWTLTQVKPGMTISHSCTPDTKVELTVGQGYDLETGPASGIGKHRIIVIEKFVNSAVDVRTGQKHTTTTNAYRSEEHTSELQSHLNLVCRLLLEKKKKIYIILISRKNSC